MINSQHKFKKQVVPVKKNMLHGDIKLGDFILFRHRLSLDFLITLYSHYFNRLYKFYYC